MSGCYLRYGEGELRSLRHGLWLAGAVIGADGGPRPPRGWRGVAWWLLGWASRFLRLLLDFVSLDWKCERCGGPVSRLLQVMELRCMVCGYTVAEVYAERFFHAQYLNMPEVAGHCRPLPESPVRVAQLPYHQGVDPRHLRGVRAAVRGGPPKASGAV